MSTLAPPESAGAAANPDPPNPRATSRRTLLGFVGTRRVVEVILTVVLGVGGGLLLFGAHFGLDMVHSQLNAQDISFPAKGSPGLTPAEFPDLQQYAGQKVDTGPKAKAYANGFIRRHLEAVAGGQTYSQVSAASLASPNDAKLTAEVATLFKGETLRGLLLYAWAGSATPAQSMETRGLPERFCGSSMACATSAGIAAIHNLRPFACGASRSSTSWRTPLLRSM